MFGNTTTMTCEKCHNNCEFCFGSSEDDCIEI